MSYYGQKIRYLENLHYLNEQNLDANKNGIELLYSHQ